MESGWRPGWSLAQDRSGWPVDRRDPRPGAVVRVDSRRVRLAPEPGGRAMRPREEAAARFAQRCCQFLPRGTAMQRLPARKRGVDARGRQPGPRGNRPGPPGGFPDGAPMVAGGYRAGAAAVKIATLLWLASVMPITFNHPELPHLPVGSAAARTDGQSAEWHGRSPLSFGFSIGSSVWQH